MNNQDRIRSQPARHESNSESVGHSAGGPQPRSAVPLFQVRGIRVTLDYSWFLIFFLVFFSLSAGYFPRHHPGLGYVNYWLSGLLTTLLFFASIIIHELSHSFMALRAGIKIPEITLFLFGGVSRLSAESKNPRTEFKIAAAGPLTSFLLAALFWAVSSFSQAYPLPAAIFHYLSVVNIALGIFNLMPGYPLDGGRILRSYLWWKKNSLTEATRIASNLGRGFAVALMVLGAVQLFSGTLMSGMWLILIGMFLKAAAGEGYQDLLVKQALEHVKVQDVMAEDVASVSPELPLDQLIRQYFFHYCASGFPVTKEGRVIGLVSVEDVKRIPESERPAKKVADVLVPIEKNIRINPQDSLASALDRMAHENIGRLLVMEDGHLDGIVSKLSVYRFLEIKNMVPVSL